MQLIKAKLVSWHALDLSCKAWQINSKWIKKRIPLQPSVRTPSSPINRKSYRSARINPSSSFGKRIVSSCLLMTVSRSRITWKRMITWCSTWNQSICGARLSCSWCKVNTTLMQSWTLKSTNRWFWGISRTCCKNWLFRCGTAVWQSLKTRECEK